MTKFMHALCVASAIVLMGAAAAGPARADALTAKDILSNFNLVTTGNVSTQSDIVGDAVVGGTLSGATFFGGGAHIPASPTLYLFGKLNSSLNLNSGGSLFYAGSSSQKVNYNGGGKLHTTLPNPLGYYTDALTDLSTQLSDLTATTGTSFVKGNFNAGSNTGIVVFDISGSTLASDLVNHDISFTGKGVTSYIINVIGNFTDPNSTHFNVDQEDALFNFEDATKVNLGQWGASILALDAALTITGGGNIEGSVFAKSFLGGGELHNNNLFNGALPTIAAVPEPSTWAMLFAGFAGLGFLGWRRARNDAAAA
jgi:choice-of-anchor A domain-containing protein